jgi:hypothetical protein
MFRVGRNSFSPSSPPRASDAGGLLFGARGFGAGKVGAVASSAKAVRKPDEILLELLERLAFATELVEVNIAAGAARNELLGVDTD